MPKEIVFSKNFKKAYKRRFSGNKKLQKLFQDRLNIFRANPNDKILKNHSLKGNLRDYRSFSITGDYRLIYQEVEDYYVFVDIGTHNQVY
jgi:mRNA interferase YafQ